MCNNFFVFHKQYTVIFIAIFSFASFTCIGQRNPFKDYSEFRSIPSKVIMDAIQDKKGKMWFITNKGVMTYDAVNWYLFPDSLGLPTFETSQIIPLKNGGVAVAGINNHLERIFATFNNEKWEIHKIPKVGSIHDKFYIRDDNNGTTFFSSYKNTFLSLNTTNKTTRTSIIPKELVFKNVRKIINYKNDILLLTTNGIYTFSNDTVKKYSDKISTVIEENEIRDIYLNPSKDTLVVLGKNKIAITINSIPFKVYNNPRLNQKATNYFSTLDLKNNRVFYTLNGPLFMLDLVSNNHREIIGHGDRTFAVWSKFLFDRQNNLWLCNMRGVSKITALAFQNYDSDEKLPEDEVSTILHLPNNLHFIGQNRGFTLMYKNDSIYWSHIINDSSLSRIQDAISISDNEIYAAASNGGLLKIYLKEKKVEKMLWAGDYASCVNFRNDTVWVCDLGKYELYYKEKLIFTEIKEAVRKVAFDDMGNVNLLTRYGLYNLSSKTKPLNPKTASPNDNVYFIHNYNHSLLVGTLGGLYSVHKGHLRKYLIEGVNEELPVYSIEVDQNNHLWLGTSSGIYQIENNKVINYFDVTSGLIGNEVNRMGLSVDDKNNIWIGTDEGMTIINKNFIYSNPESPNPYIKYLFARSREVNLNQNDKIKFNENDIEITFGALTFINEDKIEYKYKLVGLDEDWVNTFSSAQHTLRYNYLHPGKYQFTFQARELGGNWSLLASSKIFTIKNPFYLEIWFIITSILVFSIILVGIFKLITFKKIQQGLKFSLKQKMQEVNLFQDKLVKRNEELEKLNEEQDTLVYSISHDLRGPIMSTKGLINLYNFEKSASEKDHYVQLMDLSMTRLDGFINNILNISRNSRLAIKNEPVDLQSFITNIVDGHRFRDEAKDIQFSISCENQIINSDPDRLAMIMTNLISNAIVYSNPGETDKKICVSTKEVEETFQIIVHDNGVGIHKDYISDIFKIFVRANETKSGSGLGLYIANQTAEKLNAKLEVKSEYGKWTEFILILPK